MRGGTGRLVEGGAGGSIVEPPAVNVRAVVRAETSTPDRSTQS